MPAASAPRSAAPCSSATSVAGRVDQQEPITLLPPETGGRSVRPPSAARPGRCCRRARPRAAAGPVDPLAPTAARRRASCGARRSSSWRRQSPARRRRPRSRLRRSHGFARSASVDASDALKREAPGVDERPADAEDARVCRLVEIQAARIVAGQHPERFDVQRLAGFEPEGLAAVAAVRIVRRAAAADRRAAGSRRCPSGDRCAIGAFAAERVDRDEDERRRRDDADGEHAAARPIRRRCGHRGERSAASRALRAPIAVAGGVWTRRSTGTR